MISVCSLVPTPPPPSIPHAPSLFYALDLMIISGIHLRISFVVPANGLVKDSPMDRISPPSALLVSNIHEFGVCSKCYGLIIIKCLE